MQSSGGNDKNCCQDSQCPLDPTGTYRQIVFRKKSINATDIQYLSQSKSERLWGGWQGLSFTNVMP